MENYAEKTKKILSKSKLLEGCNNRMCVTEDDEELRRLYACLTLYAAELYHLNRERLYLEECGDAEPPVVKL